MLFIFSIDIYLLNVIVTWIKIWFTCTFLWKQFVFLSITRWEEYIDKLINVTLLFFVVYFVVCFALLSFLCFCFTSGWWLDIAYAYLKYSFMYIVTTKRNGEGVLTVIKNWPLRRVSGQDPRQTILPISTPM